MFDYLYKFNSLDDSLKLAVSSPEAIYDIEALEAKYGVSLASIIMRVMTKDISLEILPLTLSSELQLNQSDSEKLAKELETKIFIKASGYLGLKVEEEVKKPVALPESIFDLKEEEPKMVDKLSWARDITNSLNIVFSDEELKTKFIALLDKYIRGIKDKVLVRQILGKSILENGFALSDKVINDIFSTVEKKQNEQYRALKEKLNPEKNILRKIERLSQGNINKVEDFSLIEAPEEVELIEAPEEIELLEEPIFEGEVDSKLKNEASDKLIQALLAKPKVIEPKIVKPEIIKPEPKIEKVVVEEKPAEIKIVEEPKKKEVKSSWSVLPSGKVKMDEIKRVKTMGPVDELKYMDLTNFHRLAEDPSEAFEKIGQKLKVLENIDYGKMLEGVKAWRQNPINKLYLNIFAQAGNEGKSVSQIIAERKAAGKEYLSQEEINGLLKFNKKISF